MFTKFNDAMAAGFLASGSQKIFEESLGNIATANEQMKLNADAFFASMATAAKAGQGLAAEGPAMVQRIVEAHAAGAAELGRAGSWPEAIERQSAFSQAFAQSCWREFADWSEKVQTATKEALRPINDRSEALVAQLRRPA